VRPSHVPAGFFVEGGEGWNVPVGYNLKDPNRTNVQVGHTVSAPVDAQVGVGASIGTVFSRSTGVGVTLLGLGEFPGGLFSLDEATINALCTQAAWRKQKKVTLTDTNPEELD
jgi:hypothetical protein